MSSGYLIAWIVGAMLVLMVVGTAGLAIRTARRKSLDRWMFTYIREWSRYRGPQAGQPVHLILCIADHFEPGNGGAPAALARDRVERWVNDYPALFGQFRDRDGRPPRHTFFYPLEQYDPEHLDALAELCRQGFGEVEVHLHHDDDAPDQLRASLMAYKELLVRRHGLLPREKRSGAIVYGFIHGNWALDNSRPDGRCCGVNNELEILRETGCYADFTLPSAPDATQTRIINSIYYAVDDPIKPKSHDRGTPVGTGLVPSEALMLIQGPLVLDWKRRKWGFIPRIENGCIQGNQPATIDRVDAWLKAGVQIATRPDWFFVKLHTHGAPEANQRVLLDEPMIAFHRALAQRSGADPSFHFHYVTAREMYNLARAAEAGWTGTVAEARDYMLVFNGATGSAHSSSRNLDCAATDHGTCSSTR
jgi:hypothetical protein